jgi:transposase-like protein
MGKTVPMDKRLLAITAGELPGVTVTSLCAELGISRKTYYEWRKRHDKEGPAGSSRGHDGRCHRRGRPRRGWSSTSCGCVSSCR